ncbi:MAG: hypothetical protein WCJ30_06275 [Deltaproteobacteria bacterium]
MRILLPLVMIVPLVLFIGMGLMNFMWISRAAGIPYYGPSSAFKIYRHAFTVMKTSPETRNMLIGFAGGVLWPIVAGGILSLLHR